MNQLHASLGLHTASRRLEIETGARPASVFEMRLRSAEIGAEALNLNAAAVHLATEIAAFETALNDHQRIVLILLILVTLAALQEGSTRFPVTGEQSRGPMRTMLRPLCGEAEAEAMAKAIEILLKSDAASAVVGRKAEDYTPLLYLEPFIYHQRIRTLETALATRLAALFSTAAPAPDDTSIQAALGGEILRPGMRRPPAQILSPEQCDAVAMAVRSRLALITGGPGTGKTSIVLGILRVLARLGVTPAEVALAAPTGKAAYRIGESIRDGLARIENPDAPDRALIGARIEPVTLHRLLGYSPALGRFRHHRNNPIAAAAVVVDESSMLDLALMERLVNAIRPQTQLILLGDANQLPSVAAGAVFRDLLTMIEADGASASCGRVRLTRSYRTDAAASAGRSIVALAGSINDGLPDVLNASGADAGPIVARRGSADRLAFAGVEYLSDAAGLLERWHRERLRGDGGVAALRERTYQASEGGFDKPQRDCLGRLFEHYGSFKILCASRVLGNGVERINSWLHRLVAAASRDSAERSPLLVGEPVVVLRNDYERMLFNGDQGLVLSVQSAGGSPKPMAVFPRGDNYAAFRLEALRDEIELCYAMTVHKAQGTEFDTVVVMLPDRDSPILTRELMYTAVSRARSSVVIVGSEEILRAAIDRKSVRYSGLGEQLAALRR